jgi:hypothetical protein
MFDFLFPNHLFGGQPRLVAQAQQGGGGFRIARAMKTSMPAI